MVRAISEAHGRVLVAGHGFVAFLNDNQLDPIAGLNAEVLNACAIPEGWLLAGGGGVWKINPVGAVTLILSPAINAKGPLRLCRINSDVVVSGIGISPLIWSEDRLISVEKYAKFTNQEISDSAESLFVTSQGVRDESNRPLLPSETDKMLLKAGLVGVAKCDSMDFSPDLQ
ncbi:MAG: hypothetical protein IPN11_04755 [Opitutaceae bacterium]|nr:hypothetical protein [Opitutaceae bacterium]